MAQPPVLRRSRGTYAPLLCLNCRRRKIKCVLPDHRRVEPSEQPQPIANACQRCQALGLDCVVQRTVLGRPAAKRKRTVGTQIHHGAVEATEVSSGINEHSANHADVREYLLTEVEGDNTTPSRPPKISPKFEAMVSSSRLMSALLAKDRHFAASSFDAYSPSSEPLTGLISHGMAAILDESLVWHRFFIATVPTLVNLRNTLAANRDDGSKSATELLYALLVLLALETPSCRLREDQQLKRSMRRAVVFYGQQIVYDLPTHRYTFAALLLMFNYEPTILVSSQNAAASAVGSDLFMMLTKRVGERLGMHVADDILRRYLRKPKEMGDLRVEATIMDALQWCHIVAQDTFANGFIAMPVSIMKQCMGVIGPILEIVEAVLHIHRPAAQTLFHYFEAKAWYTQLEHLVEARQHWRNLSSLANTIERHDQACQILQLAVCEKLQGAGANKEEQEHSATVISLIGMAVCRPRITVPSVVVYYAMMARLKPASEDDEILPQQALQISEQVIENLKSLQIGETWNLTQFLARYGATRDIAIETLLSQFVHAADNLTMEGALFLPPPKSAGLLLLSYCKLLVEANAARMKGWDGLDPRVDEQLALFAKCAQRLDAMAVASGGTVDDALANGCLYAASAKYIRCLHDIVTVWKTRVAKAEEKQGDGFSSIEPEQSGSTLGTLTDLEFEELFKDWGDWPHAASLDFNELFSGGPDCS